MSFFCGMKEKNDQSLQEALKLMLEEYKLSARLNETRVKQLWGTLMGKKIATYTASVAVRKHTLYLTILSAPLKQELSFAKDNIRSMMNDALGENFIHEVVIM